MSERRGGLGRGLGALIPTAAVRSDTASDSPVDVFFPAVVSEQPAAAETLTDASDRMSSEGTVLTPVAGASYAEIPVGSISPNPQQPRRTFAEEPMAELAASIRTVGLLQPVVVRASADGRYELVMGERRWRAAQQAGLATIPAIVRATDDEVLLRDALLENLHRSELNPLEEAAAYRQLLDDFGCTHDELAVRLARSRPQITNTLRLLQLPAPVQRRVAAGVLSAGHARALLSLSQPVEQERLAHRIVAEGLSVRAVEEIVAVGGEIAGRSRRSRSRPPLAARFSELASALSDRLDTRVRVDPGRSKGKVIIEFATPEDLERIAAVIAPGAGAGTADGDHWEEHAETRPTEVSPATVS